MGSTPMGSARKRAFVKNVTFRVQTAPCDKITTDFWRSRRRLYIPDLLKAKKSGVRSTFFQGVSVFIKSVTFRVQTAPFDKITIDFCRSRRRLHDSDFILTKNLNIFDKKSRKYQTISAKYLNINGFLGFLGGDLCGGPMWRTYVEDKFFVQQVLPRLRTKGSIAQEA